MWAGWAAGRWVEDELDPEACVERAAELLVSGREEEAGGEERDEEDGADDGGSDGADFGASVAEGATPE